MHAFICLDQAIFISYTPIMMMYDSSRKEELQTESKPVCMRRSRKFFQGGGPKDN